jgi:hypothetical protein
MMSGVRESATMPSPPSTFCTAAIAMVVRGHRVDADTVRLQFFSQTQCGERHPILCDCVGEHAAGPARIQIQRRRQRQDVRVATCCRV